MTAILCGDQYSEVRGPARRSLACHLSLLEHGLLDSGETNKEIYISPHNFLESVSTLVLGRKCFVVSESFISDMEKNKRNNLLITVIDTLYPPVLEQGHKHLPCSTLLWHGGSWRQRNHTIYQTWKGNSKKESSILDLRLHFSFYFIWPTVRWHPPKRAMGNLAILHRICLVVLIV